MGGQWSNWQPEQVVVYPPGMNIKRTAALSATGQFHTSRASGAKPTPSGVVSAHIGTAQAALATMEARIRTGVFDTVPINSGINDVDVPLTNLRYAQYGFWNMLTELRSENEGDGTHRGSSQIDVVTALFTYTVPDVSTDLPQIPPVNQTDYGYNSVTNQYRQYEHRRQTFVGWTDFDMTSHEETLLSTDSNAYIDAAQSSVAYTNVDHPGVSTYAVVRLVKGSAPLDRILHARDATGLSDGDMIDPSVWISPNTGVEVGRILYPPSGVRGPNYQYYQRPVKTTFDLTAAAGTAKTITFLVFNKVMYEDALPTTPVTDPLEYFSTSYLWDLTDAGIFINSNYSIGPSTLWRRPRYRYWIPDAAGRDTGTGNAGRKQHNVW